MGGLIWDLYQQGRMKNLGERIAFEGSENAKVANRVQALTDNLGELNLLLLVTLKALLDKGVLTFDDIQKYMAQLDSLDGRADGKITLADVRNALGLQPAASGTEAKFAPQGSVMRRALKK